MKLLIEHEEVFEAKKEVNMGSGNIVVISLVVSLITAALVSFNMLVAKDLNLFIAGLGLSAATVSSSAFAVRFLRNRSPIPMPMLITTRKYLLFKVLLSAALMIWFITQVVTYLSVSLWASRLGFAYNFAYGGRVLFFYMLVVTAVISGWATWGRLTNSANLSDNRKDGK